MTTLPVQFRGTVVATRKRGVIVQVPAGRGHGSRLHTEYALATRLPLARGARLTLRGRAYQDGTQLVVVMNGTHYHLTPTPRSS